MTAERPSNALIALLAGSLLLAGWVYGRPLLTGSAGIDDPSVEPDAIGFVDDENDEIDLTEPWTSPEAPRNPFLPVDTGADPAAVSGGDDPDEFEPDDG